MIDPYRPVGQFMPKRLRLRMKETLSYSSLNVDPDKFLGFAIILGLSSGFILGSIINHYNVLPFILGFISVFGVVELALYMWLSLSMDSKAKFV